MPKKLGRATQLVRPGPPPLPGGELLADETFPATPEAKEDALERLLERLHGAGLAASPSDELHARLSLDEGLVNACEHGCRYDPARRVRVRVFRSPSSWSALIEDFGPGFHEEDLPDPDAPENLLEESGRGILLIRKMMDEVSYWNGGAALLMTRRLAPPASPAEAGTDAASPPGESAMPPETTGVPLPQRVRDLETILGITRALAAETSLAELMTLLAHACTQVLQVERTSVWVVDPKSGELYTRVAEKTDGLRIPRGTGVAGAAADSGHPVLVQDAYADARFNAAVDRKSGFRTRNILCYPLKSHANDRVVGVLQALNKTQDRPFSDYDLELAALLAAQAGVVLEQAALRDEALEKKRLQAEMDLAHDIQRRLLPRESPNFPGLEIAGINEPATETSGDYYDYITLADGRPGVLVADVTGHGLGAALLMTEARAFVRALAGRLADPAQLLAAANKLLVKDLTDGTFLSLFLGTFDAAAGTFTYASAGHDPPLVYRPADDSFAELEATGPLLGILEDAEYGLSAPLALRPGDILVFMTDGLFECLNAAQETLGKERLRAVVCAHARENASALLQALLGAAAAWTGGAPPRDDITVVVVKIHGSTR